MRTIVVYHNNCVDGIAAAWAARQYMSVRNISCEYIPADYDSEPVDCTDSVIYLVDFSYPPEVIENLISLKNNTVVVIDHHISAINKLQGVIAKHNIQTDGCINKRIGRSESWLLDTTRSGAVLTFNYFFPDHEVPDILLYVQDRDLWKKELPFSEEISWALKAYSDSFINFNYLAGVWSIKGFGSVKSIGEGTYKFVQSQIEQIAENRHYIYIKLEGNELADILQTFWLRIPAVNAPQVFSSDICQKVMQLEGECIAASYFRQSDDTYKFSVRCIDEWKSDMVASRIAEMFGGGGHPGAAGFYVHEHKFLELTKKPTSEQTGVYDLDCNFLERKDT